MAVPGHRFQAAETTLLLMIVHFTISDLSDAWRELFINSTYRMPTQWGTPVQEWLPCNVFFFFVLRLLHGKEDFTAAPISRIYAMRRLQCLASAAELLCSLGRILLVISLRLIV
jgi:hypothetical protein